MVSFAFNYPLAIHGERGHYNRSLFSRAGVHESSPLAPQDYIGNVHRCALWWTGFRTRCSWVSKLHVYNDITRKLAKFEISVLHNIDFITSVLKLFDRCSLIRYTEILNFFSSKYGSILLAYMCRSSSIGKVT